MFAVVARTPSAKSVQAFLSAAQTATLRTMERRGVMGRITVEPVPGERAMSSYNRFSTPGKSIIAVGESKFGTVTSSLKERQQHLDSRKATLATPKARPGKQCAGVDVPSSPGNDISSILKPGSALRKAALDRNNSRGPYVREHGTLGAGLASIKRQLTDIHFIKLDDYNEQFNRQYRENFKAENPARPPFGGPVVVRGVLRPDVQFGQLIGNVPSAIDGTTQLASHINAMLQGGCSAKLWLGEYLLHFIPRTQQEARAAIALKHAFKSGDLSLAMMRSTGEFEVDFGLIGPQDEEEVIDPATGRKYIQSYPGGSWQYRMVDPAHARKYIRVEEVYHLPQDEAGTSKELVPYAG